MQAASVAHLSQSRGASETVRRITEECTVAYVWQRPANVFFTLTIISTVYLYRIPVRHHRHATASIAYIVLSRLAHQ